jgi:hypothetical protein
MVLGLDLGELIWDLIAIAAVVMSIRRLFDLARGKFEWSSLLIPGGLTVAWLALLGLGFVLTAIAGQGRAFSYDFWWSSPLWHLHSESWTPWLGIGLGLGVAVTWFSARAALTSASVRHRNTGIGYLEGPGNKQVVMAGTSYVAAFVCAVVAVDLLIRLDHSIAGEFWAAASTRTTEQGLYLAADCVKWFGFLLFGWGGIGYWLSPEYSSRRMTFAGVAIAGVLVSGLGLIFQMLIPVLQFVGIGLLIILFLVCVAVSNSTRRRTN